ncbi:MAG: NfeD family protein [Pyrobaculum sp.]
MDLVTSSAVLGLLGGLIIALTVVGHLPWWLGYPLGGAFLGLYLLVVVAGLRASRQFKKRPPPSASILGRRGVVVEAGGGWALVKIEGVYWKAYCPGCSVGDVVEVVSISDSGIEVRQV